MAFTRRQALKWLALTASTAPLAPALERIVHAVSTRPDAAPVIWINDGGDHLNFLAQLGNELPDLLELAATQWELVHYDELLNLEPEAAEPLKAAPILILEVIPGPEELEPGKRAWPLKLLPQAKAVILLGSDACYGTLRWKGAEVAHLEGLCRQAEVPVIKLPGVPVPPHHLVGTLGHLELVGFPRLDRYRRPILYYGETVCRRCERRADLERGRFAGRWGKAGCLLELGCKGPLTHNSCAAQKWNGGENWCVGSGGPCTGCAEPGFPHHGGLGLYGSLPRDRLGMSSPLLENVSGIGWGLFGITALGLGLRLARGALVRGGRVAPSFPGGPPRKGDQS